MQPAIFAITARKQILQGKALITIENLSNIIQHPPVSFDLTQLHIYGAHIYQVY